MVKLSGKNVNFEFISNFFQIPSNVKLGMVHGVVQDSNSRIYIQHTVHEQSENQNTILVFDSSGAFIDSFGESLKGVPHGLHIVNEGENQYLYMTDQLNGLFKTDLKGQTVWNLKKPEFYQLRPELNYSPSNVAVDSKGDIYFSDGYGSYYITKITSEGEEIGMFGGPGSNDNCLIHPHGLAIDNRKGEETLLIAFNINSMLPPDLVAKHKLKPAIKRFDLDGNYLDEIFISDELQLPRHFHIRQNWVVIPDFKNKLYLLDGDEVILKVGTEGNCKNPQNMDSLVELKQPHAAWIDENKNIILTEFGGRISYLKNLD